MNQKENLFLENFFTCSSMNELCQKINISLPTAFKYKKKFKEKIEQMFQERLESISNQIVTNAIEATKQLNFLIHSSEESIQVKACDIVMNNHFKGLDKLKELALERANDNQLKLIFSDENTSSPSDDNAFNKKE